MDVSIAYNILKKQGHTMTHISQSLPSSVITKLPPIPPPPEYNALDQQNVNDSILRGVKINGPMHNLYNGPIKNQTNK